jgi:hypothetical protein
MQLLQYNWHMFWLQDMMEHVVLSKSIKNDIDNHLQKLRLCFQKCKEYDIKIKSRQMCIYGILMDNLGFYYFLRNRNTRSKENTSNSKHATT